MSQVTIKRVGVAILLCVAGAGYGNDSMQAQPGQVPGARKAFEPGAWKAVSNEKLDRQRGGFDVGAGLSLSFGIIRSISINGIVVAATSFTLPDVTKITPEQAQLASAAISQITVVQNGPGNVVGTGIKSPAGPLATGTVIQNSLDNQTIQNLTVVNASVNSLGLFKTLNTQATMREALFGTTGVR